MSRLPWTKFQDFYLRLGFLKVLVAGLSPERRSVPNNAIISRLNSPLFGAVQAHLGTADTRNLSGRKLRSVVEALLLNGDSPSMLFAVTGPTSYKILDWGRDVELMGRGNQITERGLLLRYLLNEAAVTAFLSGDVKAWNPFVLTLKEKLFFLYHLSEIDGVIVDLIKQIGELNLAPDGALDSNRAARLTCRSLLRVLSTAKSKVSSTDIIKYRTACALASTIAGELGISEEADELLGATRRVPKPLRPRSATAAFRSHARQRKSTEKDSTKRRTTKNADHQTIPRFEQLVDIGLLSKPMNSSSTPSEILSARSRWQYVPTTVCRTWSAALRAHEGNDKSFLWDHFAATAIKAFQIVFTGAQHSSRSQLVAKYVWAAYEHIHRRVGANPLDSVALFAMLSAAADGIAIEMSEIHRLMLTIKQRGLLPEHVFFSSGNDLDQMFIQLRHGFLEGVKQFETILVGAEAR